MNVKDFFAACLWAGFAASAAHAADVSPRQVTVQLSTASIASAPARSVGFSGNIWLTPQAFGNGVADTILQMPHAGLTRVSLGDQLLSKATSLDDLKQRLAAFPLDDFLRRYKAQGGRVLLILDGTPRWLASNTSTALVSGPNQPMFRMSAENNDAGWADVVQAVVSHFNGSLQLDAYYEAWNEPNYYYQGSVAQFLNQYRASVLGARRADPKAMIGGPGVSELTGVTTAGTSVQSTASKVEVVRELLGQRYLMRQFLDYAATTPLPELGLKRLPVDFVSFHAFYQEPSRFYAAAIPYIRATLSADGFPSDTPIINTEWNLAAVPPYPEGDLNATQVGAAYDAVSLMAMGEAGTAAQSFQMYVDPGVPGYSGGMFTPEGLALANFHAFQLFSMLRGSQLGVTSSDPWVRACAFRDARTVYVLVASAVPTPVMIQSTQAVLDQLENAKFEQSLLNAGLAQAIALGQPLPAAQAQQAQALQAASQRAVQAETDLAARSGGPLTLEVDASAFGGAPRSASRYVIDSHDANLAPQLPSAAPRLQALAQLQATLPTLLQNALINAGMTSAAASQVAGDLVQGVSLDSALSDASAGNSAAVQAAVQAVIANAQAQIRAALDAIQNAPGAGLVQQPVSWPAGGRLSIAAEANSVQLFVLNY